MEIEAIVERLLALMLTPDNKLKTSISVFIGAGVSREYGIPTSSGLAQKFYESVISGIDDERRRQIAELSSDEQIWNFINDFRSHLNSDFAYAFFRQVEQEALRLNADPSVVTYDRIVDLWRSGYINLVVTTNFDRLIEVASNDANKRSTDAFSITVLDYSDLAKKDRPNYLDAPLLIKIAGDIDRSNMLWTAEEFRTGLKKSALTWLERRICTTPVLLLGYTASEEPLALLLGKHPTYLASVDKREREEISTLEGMARKRPPSLTDHATGLASEFVRTIYDCLYQRTRDPRLTLSFLHLRDRLARIEKFRGRPVDRALLIPRPKVLAQINDFINAGADGERVVVVQGDSGHGKTVMARDLAAALAESDTSLSIYIPASELVGSGLDEWFRRVEPERGALRAVCHLARILDRRLILIVDGLNEITDATSARTLLNDIVSLLDPYHQGHVRCVITCRTDYWTRLRFDFDRAYRHPDIILPPFDVQEVQEGVSAANLCLSRNRFIVELLRTPINYGMFRTLAMDVQAVASELSIYRMALERCQASLDGADRTLIWLCRQFYTAQAVSLKLIDAGIGDDLRGNLVALASAGILDINRFDIVRFASDRMREFIFGLVYLHEYLWRSDVEPKGISISSFFQDIVDDYVRTSDANLDYKINLLNSLIFFVSECTDDEVDDLYASGDAFAKTLVRAAVTLRRRVSVHDRWVNDPILMATAFLDRENHRQLRTVLAGGDYRFFAELPFNFTAKLYPDSLLDFIEGYLLETVERDIRLEENREWTSGLLSAIFIFVLRNGPLPILARPRVCDLIGSIARRTDPRFLVDRLVEAVEENSRYLFHSNPVDKPSDLWGIAPYWRDLLRKAVTEGLFRLEFDQICGLINVNSMARLILKFVFCRDCRDQSLFGWLEHVFSKDDAVSQDFALGGLGWLGKLDDAFIPLAEHYTVLMGRSHPENFFSKILAFENETASQYDPLVPHVTTLLMKGLPIDASWISRDSHGNAGFRIGRLAEKTVLDFPDETLAFLYEAIRRGISTPETTVALRIASRLSPDVFWTHARRNSPSDLFEISGDNFTELSRVIAQVRDFDWWKNLSFAISTPARTEHLTKWLGTLLTVDDLYQFVGAVVEVLTSSAPQPSSA